MRKARRMLTTHEITESSFHKNFHIFLNISSDLKENDLKKLLFYEPAYLLWLPSMSQQVSCHLLFAETLLQCIAYVIPQVVVVHLINCLYYLLAGESLFAQKF